MTQPTPTQTAAETPASTGSAPAPGADGASASPTPEGAPERPLLARLGPTAVLGAAAFVLPPLGSIALFYFINDVGSWLRSHGTQGVLVYALGFAVLAGFALLPTYASAILGGWAFGFATGFPAALGGFFGASLIGYVMGRAAARDRVEGVLAERADWRAVRDALVGGGFWKTLGIVTLVRLPVNSPFALTNLVLSSVRTNPVAYAIGTLVGMAPRTGVAVFIASELSGVAAADLQQEGGAFTILRRFAEWAGLPQWVVVGGAIAFSIVVLLIITLIARRALARVTGRGSERRTG